MAVGLVVNAWLVWTTGTRLERQLAEIRAAGDPLTLADLARPPIPPEKNADTYLRKAQGDIDAIEKSVYATEWTKRWDFRGPLPADARKIIKEALDAHPEAVAAYRDKRLPARITRAGLDYRTGPGELIVQILPVVQRDRAAARVLQLRAFLLAGEGNRDEAAQTGLAILRIARLLDRNPMMISYLVAVAVRGIAVECVNFALQSGPVSADVHETLNSELALDDHLNGYVWALKSERAFGLASFATNPSRDFWFGARTYWNREESMYLNDLQKFLARANSDSSRRLDQDMVDQSQLSQGIFAAPVVPALQATQVASTRILALMRLAAGA